MNQQQILDEFRSCGALLEGHFVLSSGLHSSIYLQCARVLMDSARADRLCAELARKVTELIKSPIDMVASPAMGGVIVGYEMGRQLSVPAIFFERVDNKLTLRRGFDIPEKANCLMVEDIVTTGLSSRECIASIRELGGNVVGAACLIDRSGGKADIGVPLARLAQLEIATYAADALPASLAELDVVKPGSRGLQ